MGGARLGSMVLRRARVFPASGRDLSARKMPIPFQHQVYLALEAQSADEWVGSGAEVHCPPGVGAFPESEFPIAPPFPHHPHCAVWIVRVGRVSTLFTVWREAGKQ